MLVTEDILDEAVRKKLNLSGDIVFKGTVGANGKIDSGDYQGIYIQNLGSSEQYPIKKGWTFKLSTATTITFNGEMKEFDSGDILIALYDNNNSWNSWAII
jgi:hypothetical protein